MARELLALNALYFFYIIVIGLTLFIKRVQAVRNKQMSGKYFKDYQGSIPENLKVLENHFNNQFQVPLVFMIVSSLSIAIKQVSYLFLILAVLFILSRFAHTFVHLHSNKVLLRALFYFLGALIVALMWLVLLI